MMDQIIKISYSSFPLWEGVGARDGERRRGYSHKMLCTVLNPTAAEGGGGFWRGGGGVGGGRGGEGDGEDIGQAFT